MTGFSQHERRGLERLQIVKPETHPDADLLTAFAEHSLTAREQEQVLGHLASCSLCREVVALAGSPLVEPVPEPVRKRALWELPLFHWGAVAATAVVVVMAVSLGFHTLHKSPTAAMMSESAPVPKAEADKVVAESQSKNDQFAEASPASIPATQKRAAHVQEQIRYEKMPDAQVSKESAAAGAGASGGLVAGKLAAPPQPTSPPAAVGGPARRDAAELPMTARNYQVLKDQSLDQKQAAAAAPKVQENAPAGYAADAYQANETVSVTAQNEAVQMNSGVAPAVVEESKKAMLAKGKTEAATVTSMPAVTAFRQTRPISSLATGTDWQITNTGVLQRSFNRGGLWENMLSSHTFRSVAVVRDHIWAGGDDGLLYFSSDNGRNWSQLTVRSGASAITGNIIRLRFTDATNGTVETSTGETWSTADGGQTWRKQ